MKPILICMLLVAIGFRWPKVVGWSILGGIFFFISIGNLVVLPDVVFPLRVQQIICAVAFGVALNSRSHSVLRQLWKIKPLIYLVIFFILEIVAGLRYPDATLYKFLMLHNYPSYLAVVILTFYLINDADDYNFFWNLLLGNVVIMAVVILVELTTGYRLATHACFDQLASCRVSEQHWVTDLGSETYQWTSPATFFTRYIGVTGEPNKSAILLAIGGILCVYNYSSSSKGNVSHSIWNFNFVATIILGTVIFTLLLISQVRSAIGALIFVSFVLIIYMPRLLKPFLIITLLTSMIFTLQPNAQIVSVKFFKGRLIDEGVLSAGERTQAAAIALQAFAESYGMGVGGTIYSASDRILNNMDLTAFLLYFLAGGILLGGSYILMLLLLLADLTRTLKLNLSYDHSIKIILTISALVIAVLTQIFNDNGILFYIILLYSAAKASTRNCAHLKV